MSVFQIVLVRAKLRERQHLLLVGQAVRLEAAVALVTNPIIDEISPIGMRAWLLCWALTVLPAAANRISFNYAADLNKDFLEQYQKEKEAKRQAQQEPLRQVFVI